MNAFGHGKRSAAHREAAIGLVRAASWRRSLTAGIGNRVLFVATAPCTPGIAGCQDIPAGSTGRCNTLIV